MAGEGTLGDRRNPGWMGLHALFPEGLALSLLPFLAAFLAVPGTWSHGSGRVWVWLCFKGTAKEHSPVSVTLLHEPTVFPECQEFEWCLDRTALRIHELQVPLVGVGICKNICWALFGMKPFNNL